MVYRFPQFEDHLITFKQCLHKLIRMGYREIVSPNNKKHQIKQILIDYNNQTKKNDLPSFDVLDDGRLCFYHSREPGSGVLIFYGVPTKWMLKKNKIQDLPSLEQWLDSEFQINLQDAGEKPDQNKDIKILASAD